MVGHGYRELFALMSDLIACYWPGPCTRVANFNCIYCYSRSFLLIILGDTRPSPVPSVSARSRVRHQKRQRRLICMHTVSHPASFGPCYPLRGNVVYIQPLTKPPSRGSMTWRPLKFTFRELVLPRKGGSLVCLL